MLIPLLYISGYTCSTNHLLILSFILQSTKEVTKYILYVYIHNLNILYITQITVTVIHKLKHQCSGPMYTCIHYSIQVNSVLCYNSRI